MKGKSLTLRTDGASRGNPGPAGIGAVIEVDGTGEQIEVCAYIGESTNNVAEYRGLLLALAEAGRPAARSRGGRKGRAPQGRVPGNPRWGRPRGQCHRKHTASRVPREVRGKRGGK